MAAKKKKKQATAKPKRSAGAGPKKTAGKNTAPKGGSSKKGAKKVGRAVTAKKKATKKTAVKKTVAKKTTKKTGAKKASSKSAGRKASTKESAAKKATVSKGKTSSAKKAPLKPTSKKKTKGDPGSKKASTKLGAGVKLTAKKILAKRAAAKKAEAKQAAAKKAAAKKTNQKKPAAKKAGAKAGKKVTVKKVAVVDVGSAKKSASKSATKAAEPNPPAKETPAPSPKQRSQPVAVQEIDVRAEKEQHKRLPPFRPKSYGKKPKPVPPAEILRILSRFLGKAPTFKRELKGLSLVQLGMFCIFAVGGNQPKVCLEAVKRLVEAFPDWNEFRISDPLEFMEILEDLEIDNLYNRCERVLEFVNDVYQDQNGVDLEFLRDCDAEDRLTILDRYVSLGPALAHYLALGIQGFEGVLFHYSWARVVQRLGIVPRSGSPKTLVASFAKIFKGKDTVSAQVNLIDLGEEICLSKNQSCRTCYLVLHCKGRKV